MIRLPQWGHRNGEEESSLCLLVELVRGVGLRLIRMRFGAIVLVMRVGRLCRLRVSMVRFRRGRFLTPML